MDMTVFILIGTGERVTPFTKSSIYPSYQKLDTEDFYHTTLLSDDEIPHHICRNYTLQSLLVDFSLSMVDRFCTPHC